MQSRRRDLRLALLYKVVMGHVGIQPEHVGLVAADDRTRAKHQFKFRAAGSLTQAFRHSFAVRTAGDWNSLPSHVVEQSTAASFKAELSRLTSAAYAPQSATPIHAILHEEDCELFVRIRIRILSRLSYHVLGRRVTAKGTGPQGRTGPKGRSQCGLDSTHRRSCGTCL